MKRQLTESVDVQGPRKIHQEGGLPRACTACCRFCMPICRTLTQFVDILVNNFSLYKLEPVGPFKFQIQNDAFTRFAFWPLFFVPYVFRPVFAGGLPLHHHPSGRGHRALSGPHVPDVLHPGFGHG